MRRFIFFFLVGLLLIIQANAEGSDKGNNLPTIYVTTLSGELPSAEDVSSPEGCWGSTIINNEYEECIVEFVNPGNDALAKNAKIRVRGNSSTTGKEKKSYKIKFENKIDLFDRGDDDYKDRNWALLNDGDTLNTLIGTWVAKYCGVEYVPEVMLVNVVINGDWRGLYFLSEMVNRSNKRVNISNTGFIVENDAYWWNEEYYFRIPEQIYPMAFTFKYPDEPTSEQEEVIRCRIEKIFGMINANDTSVEDLIDMESFVAYIMTRDILRQGDGGGSNMFYALYSMENTGEEYKLKMIPFWDYDSGLIGSRRWFDEEAAWSTQHVSKFAYFPQLFEMFFFRDAYRNKWEEISPALLQDLREWLDGFLDKYGEAIIIGRQKEEQRWGKKTVRLDEEVNYDLLLIEKQIIWMGEMITN